MQVYCRGVASIRHATTSQIYEIDSSDLDWEVADTNTRQMGAEVHLAAQVKHAELGPLSWNLWEYPDGVENDRRTDANGHDVVEDFDYGIEASPEDQDDKEKQVSELKEWFHGRFEDPAQHTSYNGREGGYLWDHGGPYDARDELYENFPQVPEDIVEAAANAIEADGITEWAGTNDYLDVDDDVRSVDEPLPDFGTFEPGDSPSDEDEDRSSEQEAAISFETEHEHIPEQGPGVAFEIGDDGRLTTVRQGFLWQEEIAETQPLRDVIEEALDDLIGLLAGSNAYPSLATITMRYRGALQRQPISVDELYGLGVRLENARAATQGEIEAGALPPFDYPPAEALDSVIELHGTFVLSTSRGRLLTERSLAFVRTAAETVTYRRASQALLNAVRQSGNLVSPQATEELDEASEGLGQGPHPERSLERSHSSIRNLIIRLSGSVIYYALDAGVQHAIGAGFAESMIGQVVTNATTVFSNHAWSFIIEYAPLLRDFVLAAGGADFSWVSPLLARVAFAMTFLRR